MEQLTVNPIGKVQINEKGIFIVLKPKYVAALQGLDGFSHLVVSWWFSDCDTKEARSILQIDKPYKNGPDVMGVFATRSPERPNPLALSMAQVISIDYVAGMIEVAYIDAYDNTPVLDIKPYLPSVDRVLHTQVPSWCSDWPNSVEDSAFFDWESVFNF